jgi:Fe-S cluster biogenesis protein NfuA|tara:strand:- start:551 stop:793 length:243 start_codon:yes stop_codon:yes gene_type:complete
MGNISIIEKVENAIDEIRPYLIADGGDIKVVSVDNKNIVNLELLGSCENCPISDMTLKNGVEETIKKHAPEIKGINSINS